MAQTIGDDSTPVYRFDWEDHSRTTDEIDASDDGLVKSQIVETLEQLGRDDPDCTVTIVGFE